MKSTPFFFMLLISLIFMGLAQAHDDGDGFYDLMTPDEIRMRYPRTYEREKEGIRRTYGEMLRLEVLTLRHPLPEEGYWGQYKYAIEDYRAYLHQIGVLK